MYSTQVSTYQSDLRNAFEALLIDNGVDAYLSGHIHWYERLFPLTMNGTIDEASIINNNTYFANEGTSLTHIINGMAGNVESHSILGTTKLLNITAILDDEHYGFSKMTFFNETVMKWEFVRGDGKGIGDSLTLIRNSTAKGQGHGKGGEKGDGKGDHKGDNKGDGKGKDSEKRDMPFWGEGFQ